MGNLDKIVAFLAAATVAACAPAPSSKAGAGDISSAPADITADTEGADSTADAMAADSTADAAPAPPCPQAQPVVTVAEGEAVVPWTTLHLDGSGSKASAQGKSVGKYMWEATQPGGSWQKFLPTSSPAKASMLVTAAGTYTFCLSVWDDLGQPSCAPACQTVEVVPNAALYVQLLWDTPADADQSDTGPGAGTDLDLHLAHEMAAQPDLDCDGAPDPWFSNPFDCFWFNYLPEWGDVGSVLDNPEMDIEDQDGAGPEFARMKGPEGTPADPVAYAVGVHYQSDNGFGLSKASVAVFIQGQKAAEITGVPLYEGDLWFAGKVWWPNTLNGGSKPVLQACHQSGLSCQAGKNLMWQPSGDWCVTPCYPAKGFVKVPSGPFANCP